MAELVGVVPASALAIYAHPDDAEVSCGGTLARWARAGAEVHLVVCTTGDKGSNDPGSVPVDLAATRAVEMAEAAEVLGVRARHRLEHPDGELDEAQLRRELVVLVREVRPEVVVCPDPTATFFGQSYFNHRDHRTVGWAALDAVAPSSANPHYFPDAGPPHQVATVYLSGTLEPDVWVEITSTIDVKTDAVLCHRTQLGDAAEWSRTVMRQRAEEAGRTAGVALAEGFRRLVLAPP